MSKKIEGSEFKEYVDSELSKGTSLSVITEQLNKFGLKISKSSVGTYARNRGEELTLVEVEQVVENSELNEIYKLVITEALIKTKACRNGFGVLPSHVYKSILDLQKILKGQLELNALSEEV